MRKIRLGWARTSEGGFYGVDIQGDDAILLCCNKSIYDDVSGDEKVLNVVDAEDICDILKPGDYVNGCRVDEVNVNAFGGTIYCNNYKVVVQPSDVKQVVTREKFSQQTFELERAYNRVKELESGNED